MRYRYIAILFLAGVAISWWEGDVLAAVITAMGSAILFSLRFRTGLLTRKRRERITTPYIDTLFQRGFVTGPTELPKTLDIDFSGDWELAITCTLSELGLVRAYKVPTPIKMRKQLAAEWWLYRDPTDVEFQQLIYQKAMADLAQIDGPSLYDSEGGRRL